MENKSTGKTVIIILLLLALLGLGGYIVYDKFLSKELNKKEVKEETKKEESQKEDLDITSKEVITLFNNINSLSNETDVNNSYYAFLFKENELKVDNMSNDTIVAVAIHNIYNKYIQECDVNSASGCYDEKTGFTGDKVKAEIKKVFGDIKFDFVDINQISCLGKWKYSQQNNNYTSEIEVCGGQPGDYNGYEAKIIKAEKQNNVIDISVKLYHVHFTWYDDGESDAKSVYDIYTDFEHKNKLSSVTHANYKTEDIFNNYSDKLDTYKLHFEKEDGEYHFKSIEKQ